MGNARPTSWRLPAVLAVLALHAALHIGLGAGGRFDPFEPFNLLLLAGNLAIGAALLRRPELDPLVGLGMMALVLAHAFIGHRLAPDSLTSGAILMVNILVLYVGVRIHEHLPMRHWIVFVASYLALYGIFVVLLENAEPLFLLFLLGMVACARSLRLMAYFWAFVLSFTAFQPYAWEGLFLTFFLLTAVFGARAHLPDRAATIFLGAGMALVLLVLVPVVIVLFGQDLHNIESVVRDPVFREALGRTVLTASLSTAVLAVFAVPLAYALARLRFPGRSVLLSLIDLPVVIPQSVAGVALLQVFGRQQVIGEALERVLGLRVDGTLLGICIAQIFVALPFLTKAALAAFESVDQRLELAARSLGASSWQSFARISLPLAARGIFLGLVLAWARAAGEFGALVFVAPHPVTAPVHAYNRFNAVGVVEAGPVVAALLLFSLAMFFLLQLTTRLLPSAARTNGESA